MSLQIFPSLILFIFPLILEEIQKPTYKLPNGKQQCTEGLHQSWVVKKDIFGADNDWVKLQIWIRH